MVPSLNIEAGVLSKLLFKEVHESAYLRFKRRMSMYRSTFQIVPNSDKPELDKDGEEPELRNAVFPEGFHDVE